jgi:hypothetical protein
MQNGRRTGIRGLRRRGDAGLSSHLPNSGVNAQAREFSPIEAPPAFVQAGKEFEIAARED